MEKETLWEGEIKTLNFPRVVKTSLRLYTDGFGINESFFQYTGKNAVLAHYITPSIVRGPLDKGGWQLELQGEEKIKLDVGNRIEELKYLFKDNKLKGKIKLERVTYDLGAEKRSEEKEEVLYEAIRGSSASGRTFSAGASGVFFLLLVQGS